LILQLLQGSLIRVRRHTHESDASLERSGNDSSKVRRRSFGLVDGDETRESSNSVSGKDTSSDDLTVLGLGGGLDGDT